MPFTACTVPSISSRSFPTHIFLIALSVALGINLTAAPPSIGQHASLHVEKLVVGTDMTARLGHSVAVVGDIALVGAPREESRDEGAVYAFKYDVKSSRWKEEAKLMADDANQGAKFGYAVAFNGERAIVGAPGDDVSKSRPGAAYVFVRDSRGNWRQEAKLVPREAGVSRFGSAVSISESGSWALVGEPLRGTSLFPQIGSAYVFNREMGMGQWRQQQVLRAEDGHAFDDFGVSVSIGEGRAFIGAPGRETDIDPYGMEKLYGAIYGFELDETSQKWVMKHKITSEDTERRDEFGRSVTHHGHHLIVGAPKTIMEDYRDAGAAYVFTMTDDGNTWNQQARFGADDPSEKARFGWTVSMDREWILVGSPRSDGNEKLSGASYLFGYNPETATWHRGPKIASPDAERFGSFGASVSIDGTSVLIGAYKESTTTPRSSGVAYVFTLTDALMTEAFRSSPLGKPAGGGHLRPGGPTNEMATGSETSSQEVEANGRPVETVAEACPSRPIIVAEKMPSLASGKPAFVDLMERVRYPPSFRGTGERGRVFVQFVVGLEGQVLEPQVTRSNLGSSFNREALRVVQSSKFNPGRTGSRPVCVQMSLPIMFDP